MEYLNAILQVVELVEVAIGKEMSNTKGAIIHGAWTNSGIHYIGRFASYMRRKKVREGNSHIEVSEHVMPLLSISPMMNIDEDDRNFEGAAEFRAEIQCANIQEVLSFYKVDLGRYLFRIIQDNDSFNVRLATLLNIPFIGCLSQKLASQVKKMFDDDVLLQAILEGVQSRTSSCKKTELQSFIKKSN